MSKSSMEVSESYAFLNKARCTSCGSEINENMKIDRLFTWSHKSFTKRMPITRWRGDAMVKRSKDKTTLFRLRHRLNSCHPRYHKNERTNDKYSMDERSMYTCTCGNQIWSFKTNQDTKPEGINRRCRLVSK